MALRASATSPGSGSGRAGGSAARVLLVREPRTRGADRGSIAKLIAPRVARVVISNPMKTRAIAEAKVRTTRSTPRRSPPITSLGCGLADEDTQALRRQVARRAHIVRQRTRLKNQVQSDPAPQPGAEAAGADLFGISRHHPPLGLAIGGGAAAGRSHGGGIRRVPSSNR
jgi:transposase